jgi:hypothetical protein
MNVESVFLVGSIGHIEMYSLKLCSTAYAAASARLLTPSFERILLT